MKTGNPAEQYSVEEFEMRHYTADNAAPQEITEELLHGNGAVAISGLFTDADIAQARSIVMAHSEDDAEKVTHFQGAAEDAGTLNRQRRVWNLLDNASDDLRQLLGAHYDYPEILDDARAGNTEGRL
ncbi:MAG: hypothetical protein GY742_15305 [Hyphomicrobiales bacterium]|nr:hypothetical protein [Hyphomicrobiales bacterium]